MVASVRWLIFAGFGAALLLCSCKNGSSKPQVASFDVLDALRPGTTLHLAQLHYQRHGPAEETLKLSDSYQPETLRNETWMTFDADGNFSSVRTESRTQDGALFASARTDAGQVIYEKHGVEQQRTNFEGGTLEGVLASYRSALDNLKADIAAHPDVPATTIRGVQTVLIEESRHPWTSPLQDVEPGNFVSTYVYDLKPVEEVRRYYATPDGSAEPRDEWAVIDAQGTETVIESWDYLAAEVLTP